MAEADSGKPGLDGSLGGLGVANWFKKRAILGTALLLASASASWAHGPYLRIVQGEVLVNDGSGFRPIQNGAEVVHGQQLQASPNSICELDYPDGSVVQVPAGSTVIASEQPVLTMAEPLANGPVTGGGLPSTDGGLPPVEGGAWAATVNGGEATVEVASASALSSTASVALGVAGVAGAVAGVVAVAGSASASAPASP